MSKLPNERLPRGFKSRNSPLWQGPEGQGPEGGITFSLLSRFLTCRERFRITTIEGIKPTRRFEHKSGYGDMWHVCEEALAAKRDWTIDLRIHCKTLSKKYPFQQDEIDKWYNVCKVHFPLYVAYWKKNPDVVRRTPLLQEQVFDVPYKLPSGRVVRLRGKFDAVDLIRE